MKKWLTTKEAEKYTNLCFKTLKKYWLEGHLQAKKIGNKWLWDRESIDNFLGEEQVNVKNILQKVGVKW